jgi:ABC transporter substrate binding protein
MIRERAEALLIVLDPFFGFHRSRLSALAAKSRIPAMYGSREYPEAGGLMSYGANFRHNFHRSATYVDKILKGAKPADLPIEQPVKFELVINLKTAKLLGDDPAVAGVAGGPGYRVSDVTLPNITLQRTGGSRCSPLAAERGLEGQRTCE